MLRHAELVASARKDEGPISIGGAIHIVSPIFCRMLSGNQLYEAHQACQTKPFSILRSGVSLAR